MNGMKLVYQGSLMLMLTESSYDNLTKIRLPQTDDATGLIEIESKHMTLLSGKQLKAYKEIHGVSNKQMKNEIKDIISKVDLPEQYTFPNQLRLGVAEREDNKTAFLIVVNQDEMQSYLDMITDKLGIPRVERYFHISVANLTGKPTDSIGDINKGDE